MTSPDNHLPTKTRGSSTGPAKCRRRATQKKVAADAAGSNRPAFLTSTRRGRVARSDVLLGIPPLEEGKPRAAGARGPFGYVTDDHMHAVAQAAETELHDFGYAFGRWLALPRHLGLTVGELLALLPTDIDLARGELLVYRTVVNGSTNVVDLNLPARRRVPIDGPGIDAVSGLPHHHGVTVVVGPDGEPTTAKAFLARLGEISRRAGLPGLDLRALRRSHARDLYSRGLPLPLIGARLGVSWSTAREQLAQAVMPSRQERLF